MILILRRDVLTILTVSGFSMLAFGALGIFGALTHRKYVVVIFMFLLWAVGGLFLSNGYITFKQVTSFQFEGDMSRLWSNLGDLQATVQAKVIHAVH